MAVQKPVLSGKHEFIIMGSGEGLKGGVLPVPLGLATALEIIEKGIGQPMDEISKVPPQIYEKRSSYDNPAGLIGHQRSGLAGIILEV
jgi:hypothetical protein